MCSNNKRKKFKMIKFNMHYVMIKITGNAVNEFPFLMRSPGFDICMSSYEYKEFYFK